MEIRREKSRGDSVTTKRYFPIPTPYAGRGRRGPSLFFMKKNRALPSAFAVCRRGGRSVEVNQKQLAQCLGISTRRIRQLREDGVFQKTDGKATRYNLEKCIQEYIDYKVNAETGRRTSISKEEVQAQHEEVKKQISLLKLRRMRRELHEAADVENFLSDMLIRFRNRMLAVAPRVAIKAVGETDISKLTDIIQKEMLATLEELSEYNPDEIEGMGSGDIEDCEDDEYLDEDEDGEE